MQELVRGLAALHRAGRDVILVSSGAVGAGIEALGLKRRPATMPDLQMAAAVGQTRLMTAYDQLFSTEGCRIGQMLLTHDGLKERERHLNARNTLMNLLRHRIIPVINENDVVAVEEIRFGDNDMLAALVALLMPADLLILLTSADGLREPTTPGRTRRIPRVEAVTPEILALVNDKGNHLSTGGMASKLDAARTANEAGVPVVIAHGRREGVLEKIADGQDTGTLIGPVGTDGGSRMRSRKRWIAFFHKALGSVVVDEGAGRAVVEQGRSLLPIGVRKVEGQFSAGALVNIKGLDGTVLARGLSDYGSEDLCRVKGRKGRDLAAELGPGYYEEVIHRDNMVIVR
jgi:glutamate 5-kinase